MTKKTATKPGRPASYPDPPAPKRGLVAARALAFEPALEVGPGRSRDRELVRTLRKWRDGKLPELVVSHKGVAVDVSLVDWDTLPAVPSMSGAGGVPESWTSVRIRKTTLGLVESAAKALGTEGRAPGDTIHAALEHALTKLR